jgi:hypothetical protein
MEPTVPEFGTPPGACPGMPGDGEAPRMLPTALAGVSTPAGTLGTVVYEDVWLPSARGKASCDVRGRAVGSKFVVGVVGTVERLARPGPPLMPAGWAAGDR